MIVRLDEWVDSEHLGNKGKYLMALKKAGFNVPEGIILSHKVYDRVVKSNDIQKNIEQQLHILTKDNVKVISMSIGLLLDQVILPDSVVADIEDFIVEGQYYAVRSSASKEDLKGFSFAGQYETVLNAKGLDSIKRAIIDCYKSLYSETILSYMLNHDIDFKCLKMAVVIQVMIDSDYSGVAFTINPVTGDDKEIVAEIAPGLGEDLVSGKVKPSTYMYNWFEDYYSEMPDVTVINQAVVDEMMSTFLDIQVHFGYPCDIEFAIYKEELYLLQARPITKVHYSGISDIWTTADFKDGGVSATVCTPYMWSLYEYVWEYSLRRFVIESKILTKEQCDKKLGDMFYGRPYWNLSVVKEAMSHVPGYKERTFDADFGVKITYEGQGQTTGITPKSLVSVGKMALAQKKILKTRKDNAVKYIDDLLGRYEQYKKGVHKTYGHEQIEKIWYQLTHSDYLRSETTYFWQIFINTIHQSLFKDQLMKHIDSSGYIGLLSGIDNISHLLPFYDIWDITRTIRQNKVTYDYWTNNEPSVIVGEIGSSDHQLPQVKAFIESFGYHSNKELDVTYPCYYEDEETVIRMFKDFVVLDDSHSPYEDKKRQKAAYEKELEWLKAKLSPKKYEKVLEKIQKMRQMLWWREEFRDVSTRFYYIIRIYTIKLAESYVSHGILEDKEDIWFLKLEDIWSYMHETSTAKELRAIIKRNKDYYKSFRHYTSDNEIGTVFDLASTSKIDDDSLKGIGCNNGQVTGIARVIESIDEIDQIQANDILFTKFTDTGWTSKFAMLSGIVTEYGGILCHAAIVSREYGIPCIVCAHNILDHIKDGEIVTINGTTGEIIKEVK